MKTLQELKTTIDEVIGLVGKINKDEIDYATPTGIVFLTVSVYQHGDNWIVCGQGYPNLAKYLEVK